MLPPEAVQPAALQSSAPFSLIPVVELMSPLTSRVKAGVAVPIPIRLLMVSAMSRLLVPAAFWIEKAVVELELKRLLPVKVWGPVPLSKATLAWLRVVPGVAVGLSVPLGLVAGLIVVLGIQPAEVQTVTLSMTRPELLAKVEPPEALRVPLAVKSPASCSMPVVGSAISWPRVKLLPLARMVSRFRVSLESLADKRLESLLELRLDGVELWCMVQ